ncbi:MAG: amino acid ABC transporter permease [Actinomycetota bacterium]
MSVELQAQGADQVRPPVQHSEVPRGTLSLLSGAWLLLTEGGLGLLFLPVIIFTTKTDLPPTDIAAFGVCSLACLGAGALLYSRRTWSIWPGIAVPIGVAAWLLASGGLTSQGQGVLAGVFAVVVTVLLLIGHLAAGHPDAMALASAGIPFRLKVGLVWAAIFLVIGILLGLFQLDTEWLKVNASYVAKGLKYTILLALGAIVLAVILALLGALGRLSKNPVAFGISGFYTSFFRGTPLIVQLTIIYLALPQIGGNLGRLSLVNLLTFSTFVAGIVGLGLNYGAYMTEIFRAGIQSVGHGQAEAADALGMGYAQRMRRVVLPQAVRVIIPPTGNEFIAMMKDTALVAFLGSTVTQSELFLRARLAGDADNRRLESLLLAAALYWVLTAIFTFFQRKLEAKVGRGYVRSDGSETRARSKMFLSGSAAGTGGGGMMVQLPEPPEGDGPTVGRGP